MARPEAENVIGDVELPLPRSIFPNDAQLLPGKLDPWSYIEHVATEDGEIPQRLIRARRAPRRRRPASASPA